MTDKNQPLVLAAAKPETAPRKKPVRHRDALRVSVEIALPIDVMDQDSLLKANADVDAALAPLRKVGSVVVVSRLGRVPGDWLPE